MVVVTDMITSTTVGHLYFRLAIAALWRNGREHDGTECLRISNYHRIQCSVFYAHDIWISHQWKHWPSIDR